LSGEQEERITKRATEHPEAYQAYLKGRFFWNKRTSEALRSGIEFFNAAFDLDPGFALAYAGIADCYDVLAFYNAVAPREAFPRAKAAAKKALEIDSSLAEARASLAYARHYFDWDWAGAEEEYREALKRNPDYSTTHLFYANYLTTMGRFEEAHAQIRRAQEIEPLSLILSNSIGWIHLYSRRFEEAIASFRKTAELDRRFIPMHFFYGCALEELGRWDEAAAEFEEAIRLSGGGTLYRALLARAHARAGRRTEALAQISQLRDLRAETYVPAYALATVSAALKDPDAAFRELEKAWAEQSHWMSFLRVDPALDPLRADPRFEALAGRMNFPA
jgi:tetratricopeptide (TPR) repeat protein